MKPEKRANIKLIMTDQRRYEFLGCYGIDAMSIPNIENLANDKTFLIDAIIGPIYQPNQYIRIKE